MLVCLVQHISKRCTKREELKSPSYKSISLNFTIFDKKSNKIMYDTIPDQFRKLARENIFKTNTFQNC